MGLNFSIPGFFVGKVGKFCFWWLDLTRDLFGYLKESWIRCSARVSRSRNVSIFRVISFNAKFFGVLIFARGGGGGIQSSPSLEILSTSPPLGF